jgi:hypothetical protein
MKIKILKGENIFNEDGNHVCDEKGFAIKADKDVECEINEDNFLKVKSIIAEDRKFRGLNEDGSSLKDDENYSIEIIN